MKTLLFSLLITGGLIWLVKNTVFMSEEEKKNNKINQWYWGNDEETYMPIWVEDSLLNGLPAEILTDFVQTYYPFTHHATFQSSIADTIPRYHKFAVLKLITFQYPYISQYKYLPTVNLTHTYSVVLTNEKSLDYAKMFYGLNRTSDFSPEIQFPL